MHTLAASFLPGIAYFCGGLVVLLLGLVCYAVFTFAAAGRDIDRDRGNRP